MILTLGVMTEFYIPETDLQRFGEDCLVAVGSRYNSHWKYSEEILYLQPRTRCRAHRGAGGGR